MKAPKSCVVVGAGLTGATAASELARQGFQVRVYEQADVVGGHVRTEWIRGIPYEPHGAHIFHTRDTAVWQLVCKFTDFVPYQHRVTIRVRSHELSWPLQRGELPQLEEWPEVEQELASLPHKPDSTNFETYCRSLMGETLYNLCVHNYTLKQWGRAPEELSASVAANRVELRDDGYRGLFRDPHQGWPERGYADLVEALLEPAEIHLGQPITCADLVELTRPGEPVVITSALDDFFSGELGPLEWRGVRLESKFIPDVRLAQSSMVVNEPDLAVPWTRTIETKWALEKLHDAPGTVVMREYPGASAKHYPVPDSAGINRALQASYEAKLAAYTRNPLMAAGRLATYSYINMDQAVRQGLDAARHIVEAH
ncbi:FAD-dependent oxidoreductase [Streptomyces sp. NPDC001027]|uniref:FAD-dependent oxidoreductase n=1 Tax=Streptomyces sp. NPDC001027 TaxID=3154771 RepID=UPI00332538AB